VSETNDDQAQKEYGMEELRAEVEERQKAILWEDARRGGAGVDAFLWKGDPHAKPVQRAGLIVFACTFLLLGVCFVSIPFQKHFEDGWGMYFFIALILVLIAARLIRNVFLRPKHSTDTD
jgi:hypothetical protein